MVIGDNNTLTNSKQITNNFNITQTIQALKALLTELSEEDNATSPKDQNKIKADAIEKVQQTPKLKSRFLKSLEASDAHSPLEATTPQPKRPSPKACTVLHT